jgi:hypothetical protein
VTNAIFRCQGKWDNLAFTLVDTSKAIAPLPGQQNIFLFNFAENSYFGVGLLPS